MKRYLIIICVLALVASLCGVSAYAKNDKIELLSDDGSNKHYIIKMKDSAVSLCSDEVSDMDNISHDLNMYASSDVELINSLISDGMVESVSEDEIVELFDTTGYNDTYYSEQWNFELTNIINAREITTGSNNVTVAVVDSGLQTGHPDINYDDVLTGRCYTYNQENEITVSTDTLDTYGHGTAVTGIIKATSNNNEGIAGIADNVKILPIKVFDAKNSSLSVIIKGLQYAIDQNCDVINFSAGVTSANSALKEIVDLANQKGIIFVAAAGNNSKSTASYDDAKMYPASFDNAISVGAVDSNSKITYFSQKNNAVTIVAPGANVISTRSDTYAISGTKIGTSYMKVNGTSFSAPHITALAALAKSIDKSITPSIFEKALTSTAIDLGNEGKDNQYGYGLVDMAATLSEVEILNCDKIEIVKLPSQTEYIQGENLNLDDMVVRVSYLSGETEDITGYMVSGYDSTKLGEQTVTVTYLGKSATFTVSVVEKQMTGIEVIPPEKTEYIVGQDVDFSTMNIYTIYNNRLKEKVSGMTSFSIDRYDNTTAGEKIITVYYNGFSDTFTVTYIPRTVISIEVTPPATTEYELYSELNLDDIAVTAYYNDDTYEAVTDYDVSGYESDVLGKQTVTVKYEDCTAEFDVTVILPITEDIETSKTFALNTENNKVFSDGEMELNTGEKIGFLSPVENAEIYYTTDGSEPTKDSIFYNGPIVLTGDIQIKTVAYINDKYGEVTEYNITAQKGIFVEYENQNINVGFCKIEQNGKVILAVKDENEELKGVYIKDIDTDGVTFEGITAEENDRYYVFVWEDFDDIVPICDYAYGEI